MSDFQKVLITGATGFIGSNLVKAFVREKRDVHVITRASSNLDLLRDVRDFIHVHVYDGSFDCLLKIVHQAQPSTVFHLASEFIAQHQSAQVDSLLQNNVVFPSYLAEAMAVCGVKRLINTGTSWQYFDSIEYRPVNLYAATKQAFEDVMTYYVDAFEWRAITLNLFDTYGKSDPRKKLIQVLLNTAKSQEEIQMSPGEQLIDLVHVNDVIEAFIIAESILDEIIVGHHLYGVSSNAPIQLRDLVELCEKAWNVKLPVAWGARTYRDREVMRPWHTYESLPSWTPKVSLMSGLREVSLDF